MFGHGLVLGKFWPLHAGHSHLINTASEQCERVTVQLLVHPDETIPLETRAAWIREIHPDVNLVTGIDDVPTDFEDPHIWDLHMAIIEGLLDSPVDAVFTSDDYGAELADRLSANWVQVDPGRVDIPVSGTAVRADPIRQWQFLHPAVRAYFCRRVIITGAESTGTTSFARALSQALDCPVTTEYGREYSETRTGGLDTPWRTGEFTLIAAKQIELEDLAARASANGWLVGDTDALTTTLWHERYVDHLSDEVAAISRKQAKPFARILTGDDIPFVQDGLRDGEHIRHDMQQKFRDTLARTKEPWIEVHGSPEERLSTALDFINSLK